MAGQGGGSNRPPGAKGGAGGQGPKKKAGGLRLRRLAEDDYELDHPPCIHEMELDYQEGIEMWEAGDPEEARDALRYALQGCGDNMYVHVALGRIALESFKDPSLARGHFGFAYELADRALPRGFAGRIPRHLPANQPLFEAAEGLATCYEALGQPREAESLRRLVAGWEGRGGPPRR